MAVVLFLYTGTRSADSIEYFMLYVLGGFNHFKASFILDVLIFALPFLLYLYLFGSFFSRDFTTSAIFSFTRFYSKSIWFINNFMLLILYTAIYFSLLVGVLTVCLLFYAVPILSIGTYASFLLAYFINCVLNFFLFALLMNILCIHYENPALNFTFIVIPFYFFQFALTPQINDVSIWAFLLPSTHSLLFLHSIPALTSIDATYFALCAQKFTIYLSLFYQVIAIGILLLIGVKTVKNRDLL